MKIELTKEETENLILVALDYLQQNSNYPENGIGLKLLARTVNIEENGIKKYIQELKEKKAVTLRFDPARSGEFYITPTEQTLEQFGILNALSMNETATLLLKKTYDIYKRANYNSCFQFDSSFIGGIVGLTNNSKVRSAIELLEDKGLINNPAVMMENIIYFIAPRGIDMIENGPEKQMPQNTTIINNGGNVAVNSNNVQQSIHDNELERCLAIMEKLITEKSEGKEKSIALNDIETLRELLKVEQPKKSLVQTILSNLDKLPYLIEMVKMVRVLIG